MAFFRFAKDEKSRILFFKITVVLIFLRFAVPSMSFVNDLAYNSIVKPEYNIERLNENIMGVKEDVAKVMNQTIEDKENKSILVKFTEKLDSSYYTMKVDEYKKAVDNSSEYIIALIIAFVFQTIFLPLVFLFVLYHLIRGIFSIGR